MRKKPSNDNKSGTTEAELFARYLDICNKALDANKDQFPYKQIWEAAQSNLRDKTIALAVYDDHPKATYDLTMHDNQIDIVDVKEDEDSEAWHVNLSYLEKVVSDPEEYINHPAKIDWDWLRSRLSLDS